MEILYYAHGGFHALWPWLSWPIVVGGVYGAFQLVRDFARFMHGPSSPKVLAGRGTAEPARVPDKLAE